MNVSPLIVAISAALPAFGAECAEAVESARAAYQAREYSAAVVAFERAARVCPEPGRLLTPLAQARLMAGRLEASLATLDELLTSEPRDVEALKLRGDALYLLGREEEAAASLEAALAIAPGHRDARYALGRVRYHQGRLDEAVAAFQALVERDPTDYRAHDNLALAYAAQRRDADALRHFLRALDLVHRDHPEQDVVYADAAEFFLDRGEYEKAFQLVAEAAERNPAAARNFFLAGKALARLEKHELSLRWLREAARLDPGYKEPRYWLFLAYRKLGRAAEAEREAEVFQRLSRAERPRR